MPYTPNNPYIPGDPYSYDLKWIVCQLHQITGELSGLDSRIQAAVMQTLDQHDPIYFKTADELITSGIKTEALAYIEGYHEPGDMGANLYYTTSDFNDVLNSPFYITLDGANRWAIPIILTPYITPQMFGAYGDNEHDDTEALTTAFNLVFEYKKELVIPIGDYLHTGIVIEAAAFSGVAFAPVIQGISRGGSRLKHTGEGIAITIRPRNNVNYVQGIRLENLSLVGSDNTTSMLDLSRGTRYHFEHITIDQCVTGINSTANIWISTFQDIYIGSCQRGISLTGNASTSLTLNEIYVYGSTDAAYILTANYSNIGVLAADYCSGNQVYNFTGFNGSAGALACENASAANVLRCSACHFTLGLLTIINSDIENIANPINCTSNSCVDINEIRINAPSAATYEKPIGNIYSSRLSIAAISGNVTLNPIDQASAGVHSVIDFANVNYRPGTMRPYLGRDRVLNNAALTPAAYNKGVAIFTNAKGSPRYDSDGNDHRYRTPVKAGDWFIENDPLTYMTALYVALADNSSDANAMNIGRVPILKSGNTASRPTGTLPAGLMYFDTTLGKPIFFKSGTTWVDATGATV